MLVLFDIDGTLVATEGAGKAAMQAAGRELFGPAFTCDGVRFSGKLDPELWRELGRANALAETEDDARFRAAYARHLERGLARGVAKALPGVLALLAALEERRAVHLGLLTGNWPETGGMKIAAAGIAPERFATAAWGSDAPTRPELLAVALERLAAHAGRQPAAADVVVVGDTPADVLVAREGGARALAVATGTYGVGELAAAGADRVVDTLADTAAVLAWLAG